MKKSQEVSIASPEYRQFIENLKSRVLAARLSAARAVNCDLILLYWDIGRGIVEKQQALGWGESVVEMVAADLQQAFPAMTGFSPRNLRSAKQLYLSYSDPPIWLQTVAKLPRGAKAGDAEIWPQAAAKLTNATVALESSGNAWMEQIPRGWKLVCLKRIAEVQGGLTLGKQYEGPLIERPYLRVGNVQDGHLDLTDVSVIELPASVAAGVELRPDDVLMTEGGDLDKLGRGYLWKGEIPGCLHQNHIFAVRCFLHKLKPMFLAYVTAAKYGRDYFEATGKKTTNLACTNATKVGEFPIPLPPLAEQESICAHLDERLGELNGIVACIESQLATLTAYRKSLIHECVTGQRRITEADLAATKRSATNQLKQHQS